MITIGWDDFYSDELSPSKQANRLGGQSKLISCIMEENPSKVFEIGIGTGSIGIYLSKLPGIDVLKGIDNNKDVVELAKKNNSILGGNADFSVRDAFNIEKSEKFDVAFSQGLLEHFESPEDVNKLIESHLIVAETAIFTVPSRFYAIQDFGNEKLRTRREWREIISNEYKIEKAEYFRARIPHLIRVIFEEPTKIIQVFKGYIRNERPSILFKVKRRHSFSEGG